MRSAAEVKYVKRTKLLGCVGSKSFMGSASSSEMLACDNSVYGLPPSNLAAGGDVATARSFAPGDDACDRQRADASDNNDSLCGADERPSGAPGVRASLVEAVANLISNNRVGLQLVPHFDPVDHVRLLFASWTAHLSCSKSLARC